MNRNEYLIALQQRAYVQAVLLSRHLIVKDWEWADDFELPPLRKSRSHWVDYRTRFDEHVREYRNWQSQQAWQRKQNAHLCAWDRSFEDLADDFYPNEVMGDIYKAIEPAIPQSQDNFSDLLWLHQYK